MLTAERRCFAPALVAAGRHGLPVEQRAVVVGESAASAVIGAATSDRLAGFLTAAIDAGTVVADDETAQAIRAVWHESLLAAVVVESLAVRTATLLDDAGAVWRITKGPALAHLDYPDPNLRLFGDVDVVVHPRSWEVAVGALTSAGWSRPAAELRGRFDQRFGKGATLTTSEHLEVDLHRRFAIGRFGVRAEMTDVFVSADTIELGGRQMPVLDGPGRLLHACFHAALGGFSRVRSRRDVAQLLLVSGVDWRVTRRVAARWRAESVVARAVRDTWDVLELETGHPCHDWARAWRTSAAEERALQLFASERPFREQALTAIPVLPAHRVPAYLLALAVPDGSGIRQRVRHARRSMADVIRSSLGAGQA
jgi:hypothetical protein